MLTFLAEETFLLPAWEMSTAREFLRGSDKWHWPSRRTESQNLPEKHSFKSQRPFLTSGMGLTGPQFTVNRNAWQWGRRLSTGAGQKRGARARCHAPPPCITKPHGDLSIQQPLGRQTEHDNNSYPATRDDLAGTVPCKYHDLSESGPQYLGPG